MSQQRHIEIRPPEFWVQRIMYTAAKHTAHCTTGGIERAVECLLERYAQEQTKYLRKHLKSVSVLVDGVATQVPVTDMQLLISLDLNSLERNKTLTISFGSKLHNMLHNQEGRRGHGFGDSKDIARLRGAGLVNVGGYLLPKGEELLERLFEEGPQNGREVNKLCQGLLIAITHHHGEWSHSMLADYLFKKEYLDFSSGELTLTAKGVRLLKDNSSRLITLKKFKEWEKDLVPFLPTEQLPIYITDEDPKVREAATKRHKELEEVLEID